MPLCRRSFLSLSILGIVVCSMAWAEAPALRTDRCRATDGAALRVWRETARSTLFKLLKMDDQVAANRHDGQGRSPVALNAAVLETDRQGSFTRHLVEIDSRPDRRIKIVLTIPLETKPGRTPAVVCIHGHGGNRDVVYDRKSIYGGFATVLAERGYVTLSTNVGQHDVQDKERRTLMGERLWDLIRVVDLAAAQPEVDTSHVGCGGLSLGGEMAMWLGAMDTRIAATVSSGFLTKMENLRQGHCMCWDFPGLQERYDFADIYSLISPRPLQCQNGAKERLPGGFPVDLAEETMVEIKRAYGAAEKESAAELAIHPGGHVFDVTAGVRFLDEALRR
jgi:dienelactone hydrolase family protein